MGIDQIIQIGEEVAGLVNNLIAARNAKNQADFDTAWIAMQTKLASANLAWEMAGEPPKID